MVLNCWFIRCQACVKEIPVLNEIVKQYDDRKDILFVGLTFDSKENLNTFLKKTIFNYSIVPGQENYLEENLKIEEYPTHLIVNRQGFIVKVVNEGKEMALALNKESLK